MGIGDPSKVRGLEWLVNRGEGGTPILQPERLAYVGLRDVDVFERKILQKLRKEHGMFASTMQDVDRLGIGHVMKLALEAIGVTGDGDGTEPSLHLSFDIDCVDPKVSYNRIPSSKWPCPPTFYGALRRLLTFPPCRTSIAYTPWSSAASLCQYGR